MEQSNHTMRNYIYIFIAGSLWGTIGLFVTIMDRLGSTSSYTSFLRMFLGMILLIVLTLVIDGPKAFKVSKRTLFTCMLMGLVCQAIYNVLYSSAVSSIGMALSSVLLYTAPVFTMITSFIFFKEHITKKKWMALGINIVGCALTVTGGRFDGLSFGIAGLLFGVGAGFCYALAAIFGRLATDEGSTYAVTTYNFVFASLFLGIFTRPWVGVQNPFNPKLLLAGLMFALIPTALGYIFYFNGLRGIKESSKVPVIASIETVLATLIGVFVLHEHMGLINALGICLVLSSILIMNLKRSGVNQSQEQSYKVILWDVDGTLLDFIAAEKVAIKTCFEEFELGQCTDEMIARYSKINRSYWERLERGEITKPQVLVGRFCEFFEKEGLDVSKAEAFNESYQVRLGDTIVFCDGSDKIIKSYQGKVKQYVVSNGTIVAQTKKLKNSGIGARMDGVFLSEELGYEKPAIEFFEQVFDKLTEDMGEIPKEQMIIVGDSLTSDIRGGNRAGIKTCWYNPKHQANDQGEHVDYEIHNLEEIYHIIDGK